MTKLKKYTVSVFLFTIVSIPTVIQARKPAVSPVTGISIDDYNEISPSQAKGFYFSEGVPEKISSDGFFTKLENQKVFEITLFAFLPVIISLASMYILSALKVNYRQVSDKENELLREIELLKNYSRPENIAQFPTSNQESNELIEEEDATDEDNEVDKYIKAS